MENRKRIVLKASEIGQFHYCSYAWYLQRSGFKPKSPLLKVGTKKHETMGKKITTANRREDYSVSLRYVALVLLVILCLVILGLVIL